eukprot:896151-Prymnesium_polylepis.2
MVAARRTERRAGGWLWTTGALATRRRRPKRMPLRASGAASLRKASMAGWARAAPRRGWSSASGARAA